MIYANNAATSWPKPRSVTRAVRETLERGPEVAAETFETARAAICRTFGMRDPERFLFTPGASSALAVAVADLPWEAGDVVVTSAVEHHALARPVEDLVAHRDVRHEVVPYAEGVPFDLDRLRAVLREGRVRLVAMTAASNVTGELLPVEEAIALAHEHGTLVLVDAAQTAGVVPIDVVKLGADLLVFAGHKGPLGPQGIGGLWAAPHVAFEPPGATCSIGDEPCAPFPTYCDVGSANIAAAAGLAAGLTWLATERRTGAGIALARELIERVRDRPGCRVFAPDAPRTGAVSLAFDDLPLERAEAFFAERGVVVRAGTHCAPMALEAIGSPAGTVRVGFGPFNESPDVDAIAEVVAAAT